MRCDELKCAFYAWDTRSLSMPYAFNQPSTTSCASGSPLSKAECTEFAGRVGAYRKNNPLNRCSGMCDEGSWSSAPAGCIYQLDGPDAGWVGWNKIAASRGRARTIYSPVCAQSKTYPPGTAWFCKVDTFDLVDNAEKYPYWRVGRPHGWPNRPPRRTFCFALTPAARTSLVCGPSPTPVPARAAAPRAFA